MKISLIIARLMMVFVLVISFTNLMTGCQFFSNRQRTEEAIIDKNLTQPRLPAIAPSAEPRSPQNEFEQEPIEAQQP